MTELFQYDNCPSVTAAAADRLVKVLSESKGSILLLLSGGSSLNPVREAFKNLNDDVVSRIHLAQVDERYVKLGSSESNWQQIKRALGKKFHKTASQLSILDQADDIEDIPITYEMELRAQMDSAVLKVGVYGIGKGGLLAGMLPTPHPEEFTRFLDGRWAVSYDAKDFTRITTTDAVLTKLDEVIVFACGQDKAHEVARLDGNLEPHEQPAQLLKDAPRATIFLGDKN